MQEIILEIGYFETGLPESLENSDIFRVFLSRVIHTSNSQSCYHGWCQMSKFSKFVLPDTLKMYSLALYVLRFLCEKLCKLLKACVCYFHQIFIFSNDGPSKTMKNAFYFI